MSEELCRMRQACKVLAGRKLEWFKQLLGSALISCITDIGRWRPICAVDLIRVGGMFRQFISRFGCCRNLIVNNLPAPNIFSAALSPCNSFPATLFGRYLFRANRLIDKLPASM
jgi:hypothetical protein